MRGLLIFVFLTIAATAQAALPSGLHTHELQSGGRTRSALVYVPKKATSKPRPVVLCFHGGASNARQQMLYCGLEQRIRIRRVAATAGNGNHKPTDSDVPHDLLLRTGSMLLKHEFEAC